MLEDADAIITGVRILQELQTLAANLLHHTRVGSTRINTLERRRGHSARAHLALDVHLVVGDRSREVEARVRRGGTGCLDAAAFARVFTGGVGLAGIRLGIRLGAVCAGGVREGEGVELILFGTDFAGDLCGLGLASPLSKRDGEGELGDEECDADGGGCLHGKQGECVLWSLRAEGWRGCGMGWRSREGVPCCVLCTSRPSDGN
mmetsp:Transcript_11877/g.29978  ORF Transcript_11877/g.29978 Transcript_11877/m.29978 type:complete len:205 (+) Transcript_11877:164-778(+)